MKQNKFTLLCLLLMSLLSSGLQAHADTLARNISVTDGYVKASIPGSDVTAAYMTLHNQSDKPITLQKITGNISDRIEMHEHSMTDGMMRMRQLEQIEIAAHSKITLQPSGLHLMIFSAKQKITEEMLLPFTLHFTNNVKFKIQLPVYRYK